MFEYPSTLGTGEQFVCWGNSSISRMPGCGPNALPKNWI